MKEDAPLPLPTPTAARLRAHFVSHWALNSGRRASQRCLLGTPLLRALRALRPSGQGRSSAARRPLLRAQWLEGFTIVNPSNLGVGRGKGAKAESILELRSRPTTKERSKAPAAPRAPFTRYGEIISLTPLSLGGDCENGNSERRGGAYSEAQERLSTPLRGFPGRKAAGDRLEPRWRPSQPLQVGRHNRRELPAMPISQATILSIYGSLCDLVDAIDVVRNLGLQPDLLEGPESAQARLVQSIVAASTLAHTAQRAAIAEIMRDDREIEIDPVSGRAS